MNTTTKARAIGAVIAAAAEVARDVADQLTEAAEINPTPDKINGMVGATLHAADLVEKLGALLASVKTLQLVTDSVRS